MRVSWVLYGLGLATGACQLIAGINPRKTDPALYETVEAGPPDARDLMDSPVLDAADASEPTGCTVQSADGDSFLRVGNVVPDLGQVHFCVKPSTRATYAGIRPITKGVGRDCPLGLQYGAVFAPSRVRGGTYDVKVVSSSAKDCEAEALVERTRVAVNPGATTTVLRLGGAGTPERLIEYPDGQPLAASAQLRFIHAVAGHGPLDMGVTEAPSWPTVMSSLGPSNVEFGQVGRPGNTEIGEIDAQGYLGIHSGGAAITLGVSQSGSKAINAIARHTLESMGLYTAIVLGRANDPSFPMEVLFCDDTHTEGLYTRCGSGLAQNLTLLSWGLGMWGIFSRYADQRLPYVQQALAKTDADIVCLTNVYSDSYKTAIVEATKERFPYSYMELQDLKSKVDDGQTVDGVVPAEPTTAPCTDPKSIEVMDEVLGCIRDNCSTIPKSLEGSVSSGDCVVNNCFAFEFKFTSQDKRCYSCIFYSMMDSTRMSQSRTSCMTDPKAGMGFGGRNSQLVLSRYPLGKTETWTLGATAWRASVSRVPITLPNSAAIDVYCTLPTDSTRDIVSQPYIGFYGKGPLESEWANETLLQSKKIVEYLKAQSGPGQAVLMGVFQTGPKTDQLLGPYPEIFAYLTSNLALGVAPSFTQTCTTCTDNALNGGAANEGGWTTHIMLSGIPVTAVKETGVVYKDAVVPIPRDDGGVLMVPRSVSYGLRSVVSIAP